MHRELIRRAKKELAQDGVIHADTFMELTSRNIDPTAIENQENN
jgi:hypothetical protein